MPYNLKTSENSSVKCMFEFQDIVQMKIST